MPKTDMKLEEDPFLRLGKSNELKQYHKINIFSHQFLKMLICYLLGFGMNAYYDTLKYLMILMLLLFVFSLPSVFIYSSYSAIVK